MAYTIPQLTLSDQPDKFSPVNGFNTFVFTASFATASTTAVASTSKLFYDIEVLNQDNNALLSNLGRYAVPIRQNSAYIADPSDILKTQVTFPYDTKGTQSYSGFKAIVNEDAGFYAPGATAYPYYIFPMIAPEKNGIVQYRLHYGLQYDPGVTFSRVDPDLTYYPTPLYTIYTLPHTLNSFCSVGDIITVQVYSGLYQYYTGTASVRLVANDGTNTFIYTNQIWKASYYPNNVYISGSITNVQHFVTYSTSKWAYNGVRQWDEKDVDFGSIYVQRQTATPSMSASVSFMNDFGITRDNAIPIQQGQRERVRFLVDLGRAGTSGIGVTGSSLQYVTNSPSIKLDKFDRSGATVSSTTTDIQWSDGAIGLNQRCFTMQVFDGTETISDGYYYKFQFYGEQYTPTGTFSGYGNIANPIWYVGSSPCTKYTNYRIKFLNRQGSWAYWNFYMDNKQTSNITRTEYKKYLPYDYTINTNDINYQLSNIRSGSVLSSNVMETFTLNSDWISEDAYAYLGQLVSSPQVYVFYDNYTTRDGNQLMSVNVPIVITDTSYTYKTLNRDRLFNLTINYKYSFDTKIQNQ